MQKKLIAALALAGLAAAPAYAATANVDVYGLMSFSVDLVDYMGSDDGVTGRDNASRIGFKGSEDLGSGMSAIWQYETQLNANTGTATARNTFVGLKSVSLGTLLMGVHDSPYKLATGKLDPFADTIGDYNAIIGQTDAAGNLFDLRVPYAIAYITPTWSGFHAAIAHVRVPGTGDAWSALAMYDNGPIFASLAYEVHMQGLAGSTLTDDLGAWKVGLGYTFGNTAFGLVYETIKHDLANQNATRDAWYGSIKHTMGNIVLKAAYGQADDAASGPNTGAKFWALGGDYMLSKRTSVFGVYANLDQDSAASYNLFNYPAVGNNDISGFSLGVKHSF